MRLYWHFPPWQSHCSPLPMSIFLVNFVYKYVSCAWSILFLNALSLSNLLSKLFLLLEKKRQKRKQKSFYIYWHPLMCWTPLCPSFDFIIFLVALVLGVYLSSWHWPKWEVLSGIDFIPSTILRMYSVLINICYSKKFKEQ